MTGIGTWDPLGYTGIMLNKLNTNTLNPSRCPTRPISAEQIQETQRRSIPIQKDLTGSQLEAALECKIRCRYRDHGRME